MSVTQATIQDRFAAAIVDAALPPPAGVHAAGASGDRNRFSVYRNNVHVGLTGSLAKRFPASARLVGEDFFAGMARVFAGVSKPRSPLLFEYGDDFPDFIAGFTPAASVPYLADVARIEVAWSNAYHAPDLPALDLAGLAAVGEGLERKRLVLHPAAALIASKHPAGSIWAAQLTDPVTPVKHRNPETVVVTRPDLDVGVRILPPCDARFAEALFANATLGEAAEEALATPGFDFGAALVGLVSFGVFSEFQQE
ncbi:MAG: DUF2063 domain-containing protein [Rhizobiaceae bacterium]